MILENNNTKPSPLDTYQNQNRNLTSLNNENNIKNVGNINLTSVTHHQITSNINKTEITGITMKNNFLKNKNTSNHKNKFNLDNHTQNRISEHMEESRKYDSIRSKIPVNKINSKSFSKNKTNNNSKINNIKEDNLDVKSFAPNSNNNDKDKLNKKSSDVNKNVNENNHKNLKNNKNNSKIKIFSNENILNYNPKNAISNNRINSNNHHISPNNNLISSNSKKKDFIRISSKDNLQSKESDLADFILNNVEPLKLNECKDSNKTEPERNRKIIENDLYTNINAVNLKYKPKTAANDYGKNNEATNQVAQKSRNLSFLI